MTTEGFNGTSLGPSDDVTVPMAMAPRLQADGKARPASLWWVKIMGRLKPAITQERALADLRGVFNDTVRESWAVRPGTRLISRAAACRSFA